MLMMDQRLAIFGKPPIMLTVLLMGTGALSFALKNFNPPRPRNVNILTATTPQKKHVQIPSGFPVVARSKISLTGDPLKRARKYDAGLPVLSEDADISEE